MEQMDINDKLLLAKKIMNKDIDISSLSDEEVEEMISFFIQYISEMNRKMEKIKYNILKIRKRLIGSGKHGK